MFQSLFLIAHAQQMYQLPSSTTIFSGVGAYSAPTFNEFLPIGEFIIGVFVGAMIVVAIIAAIQSAFSWMVDKWQGNKNKFD